MIDWKVRTQGTARCVIYGKGTQLQAASTQNVPHVNDLNFTTLHLRIVILYMFSR